MTCDHCKTTIRKGEPYSLTEHGRLHASCLRQVARPGKLVEGGSGRNSDPLYVAARA